MSLLAKWNTLTCNHACIMCNYWGLEARHLSHQQVKNITLNPLIQQQQPFGKPLYPESELVFTPSEEDVRKAQKLFVPTKTHVIRYCKGVYQPSDVPSHSKPEIAFLGRSNVGKSSLIRELLIDAPKVHVRTSKTPGHTKLVNFFEVGDAFMLVDMPGYGYRQPVNFELTAEGYLKRNKNASSSVKDYLYSTLVMVDGSAFIVRRWVCKSFVNNQTRLSMTLLLVDSKVGIQPADHIAINMFFQFGVPFTFVLTKADKAGKRALYSTLVSLKEVMTTTVSSACFPQPFLVSSVKSTGIPLLKTFIAYIAGTLEAR